ncbi:uncharacterized protein LOC111338605 isoform X2 [Stylophora pistillata]|uniref:uncharacterized protein LOC111338605 isoform X2 n=1 Tax=Stylophora pistillata TaxID=50429 RepID=UPI000C05202A|nr:uncharacterized protein LOC111338605 isoform X2 [Stylophora pistillata]
MPKQAANSGGGNKDTVYRFLRELIRQGVAWFVNEEGRFRIKWDIAVEHYIEYRVKKNPQFNKYINRRKASNTFRGALLNYYKKDGAREYQDRRKFNGKNEVTEREFQMPHTVCRSLFGSTAEISDPKEHGTSDGSVFVSAETNDYSCVTPFLNDTGFDELLDEDFYDTFEDFTSDFDPVEVISKSDGNLQGGLVSDDNGFGETYADILLESSYGMLGTEDPFLTEGHALFSNTQTWSDVQLANNQETLKCDKQTCGDSAEEQLHDSGLETEIKSSSDDDIEMHFDQGGVHDICPPSGSVKGGLKFQINLKENLPEHVKSGIAYFDGIGDVELDVTNPYSFSGITLASPKCGPVPVTIQTRDGHQLGMTQFVYVDEVQEVLNQLIKEPALRSLYPDHMQALVKEMVRDLDLQLSLITAMSCQEDESDSYVAQNPAKLAQVQVKVLQLLVYVAAEEDAEQFIQMIFSTSAGKMVFDSYKAETTLPEDVARANGHNELAEYLQDVNKRLSMWNGSDVHSKSVDWQELIQAVKKIQTQSSMSEDEQNLRVMPSDEDSNLSDYFADTETSSCGSLEVDTEWLDWEETFTKDKEPTGKEAPWSIPQSELLSEEATQFDQAEDEERTMFSNLNSHTLQLEPTYSHVNPLGVCCFYRIFSCLFALLFTITMNHDLKPPNRQKLRIARVVYDRRRHSRCICFMFTVSLLRVIGGFQFGGSIHEYTTPSHVSIDDVCYYKVSAIANISRDCGSVGSFGRLNQLRILALNPDLGGKPIDLDDGMCYPADLINTDFFEVNDAKITCLLGCVLFFIGVVVGLFWRRLYCYTVEVQQTKSELLPETFTKDKEPTGKEDPWSIIRRELLSEEATQFDLTEDEERTKFSNLNPHTPRREYTQFS